jgi:hypothetical protein
VYHIGASLKDLGKKWFAFSRMEVGTDKLQEKMRGASSPVSFFLLSLLDKMIVL